MSCLLEDKQYLYTFALCRSCRPDDAMTFGIAPSIERFLDRLDGQNNNAEVLKRIQADHTHNIGVSWLEARPALAQMIDQGQLSVIRRPRPKPKKKRWTREDWNPPPKEDGPFDNTRYDSRGYPLYLDGWGDWRIDPAKPVKKGSDADGSRPLDPHPYEVWQKVANPDGTLKPEALRADGPKPRKRVTVVYQYTSGRPVAGAFCSIYDQNNTLVGGGPIIAAPQTIFQLPNHVNKLTVELHDDPLIQAYLRQPFPNPEIPKALPGWFDRMAAALSSAGDWAAGVIAGDFNENPTLSQIITNTAISMIPLVDQTADLRDIAASLRHLLWVENGYHDYLVWAGLGLTVIGLFPTVGSLVKGVLKAVFFKLPLDRLFKAFNSLAEGHAGRYLKKLKNGGLKDLCNQAIKKTHQILNALYENLHRLKDWVPDVLLHIKDKIRAILHALDECANRLNAMFTRFFDELAEKLNLAMGQKAELAFEGVPNSTVTYKQLKQKPPVFKVEGRAKNEYAGGVDGVCPKKKEDYDRKDINDDDSKGKNRIISLKTIPINPRYAGENIPNNPNNWLRGRSTVKYLSDSELETYRLTIKDGKFFDAKGKLFDTSSSQTWDGQYKAIFVVNEKGEVFASTYQKVGEFHHSSLGQGKPVAMAGEMEVENGILKSMSNRSGHYTPEPEYLDQTISHLEHSGIDFESVEIDNMEP